MGRRHFYKPGSFYRICDRSGFAVPAEDTRKEWDGVIVRDRSWEPRQPQDFVRGRTDEINVPNPRPRTPPQFVPIAVTSLVSAVGFGNGDQIGIGFAIGVSAIGGPTSLITVVNAAGWYSNDVLWIMQDDGQYFRTLVTSIAGDQVSISPSIVLSASAGNAVVNQAAQARIAQNLYPGMIGAFVIGEDMIGKNTLYEFGPQLEPYPDDFAIGFGDFGADFSSDFSR